MERVVAGGNLQGVLAGFNSGALEHAFAEGTRASQKSAVNAWRSFCYTYGVDWTLQRLALDDAINIVLSYIGFEIGIRQLKPSSFGTGYGIRYLLFTKKIGVSPV